MTASEKTKKSMCIIIWPELMNCDHMLIYYWTVRVQNVSLCIRRIFFAICVCAPCLTTHTHIAYTQQRTVSMNYYNFNCASFLFE